MAGPWDNTISVVDLLAPNKTDANKYLSGRGPKPPRYAVATIMFGASENPYVQDIGVGPLPVSNNTRLLDLSYLSTKGSTKIRNYNSDEELQTKFLRNVSTTVADITKDLINMTVTTHDHSQGDIWGIDPLWIEDDRVIYWVSYFANVQGFQFDGTTLLPQGLFFKCDITGRDITKWSVKGWYYNGQFWNSTEAFREAWQHGQIRKPDQINSPYLDNNEHAWYGTDRFGEALPHDEKAPPASIAPEGQRFAVDNNNRYVEWMDFSFYITFTRDTGMRLFDVKYKNQTILYELGLQEAIAHYAGSDPVQTGTAYLDTYYSFGAYAFELVDGYDCPTYSHYLNATFHAGEESRTHRNAICLFEMDMQLPISRHSSAKYVTVTRNTALVLRSVSTVGNYDYTFSYYFYLDGSIEVKVSASGYIQSAYYAQNDEYGYRIHHGLSGSMHDHVLTFKADVDVLGTNNSFAKHRAVASKESYPWSGGHKRSTMKMNRTWISSEDESRLHVEGNGQAQYLVLNKDETNEFGEPRGYRIMPGMGGLHHLTIQESENLINSQSFATHHMYVTKQKDTEPRVSNANNNLNPRDPIVDFNKFFDGESLDQEDLVLWVNLGMTHIPHTGDLPNTVQSTAQSSFMLLPHNYLKSDPSRQTKEMVRIQYGKRNEDMAKVHNFGSLPHPRGLLNLSSAYADLTQYAGDVAIRKFPYDPLHPYNDTDSIV
ncbi:primary-amine oxidase [Malassezia yamatoensis]|uniref:Amine oxidase n=1 Tax=Malassezia yamatoensis TaxID=253288 RepID=A0AAJ5YTA3_9BASI|nr:primary-amine oxidase [Malassezia yamatoensis]